MQTKIALLVTILAASLFVMGCASTPKTYNLSSVEKKEGKWSHKNGGLVTGRVVDYLDGRMRLVFHVKDGLLHGSRKAWHVWSKNGDGKKPWFFRGYIMADDDIWKNGILIRRQSRGSDGRDIPLQLFNEDGSPKK